MKCAICGKELDNISKLSKHIFYHHSELSSKDYYDLYLKKENEEKCKICNSDTKFVNLGSGYMPTCSRKCGCTYHRNKLKSDPEKYKIFIDKVKENQSKIWEEREISGEKEKIFERVSKIKSYCF